MAMHADGGLRAVCLVNVFSSSLVFILCCSTSVLVGECVLLSGNWTTRGLPTRGLDNSWMLL